MPPRRGGRGRRGRRGGRGARGAAARPALRSPAGSSLQESHTLVGSALGGLVASAWGVTAPFWFAFAGSALILALIWWSLLHIAHADEQTRGADARPQRSASGGERVVDPGPQGGQGDGAGLPGGHLTAAQNQQGRDGLDPEPL